MNGEFVLLEIGYWRAVWRGIRAADVPVLPYVPLCRQLPERVLPVETAWRGIESVLADLIERFHVGRERCLEFGVEHGYSTAALSCFFECVKGVDTFAGDRHTANKKDIFRETASRLAPFRNINLIRSDYRDWILNDSSRYDLIHIDIVHTFADTYACGLWSAEHAPCVLFHDTESFPTVKRAVMEIARATGRRFYNFKESNGLGILV
jgi:hypothetical protein